MCVHTYDVDCVWLTLIRTIMMNWIVLTGRCADAQHVTEWIRLSYTVKFSMTLSKQTHKGNRVVVACHNVHTHTHFIISQFVFLVPWFTLLCPRLIGRAPRSSYVLNLVPCSLLPLKINTQLITPAVSLMRGWFWLASSGRKYSVGQHSTFVFL